MKTRSADKAAESWNRYMRGTEVLWSYGTETTRYYVPVKEVIGLGVLLSDNVPQISIDDIDPDDDPGQDQPGPVKSEDDAAIETCSPAWRMSDESKAQPKQITIRPEDYKGNKHDEMGVRIKPLDKRQRLIESRFEVPVDCFFKRMIAEANDSNIRNKNLNNGQDGDWELMYYPDCPNTAMYKRISVDPFEFYTTWIHEDDWHAYITMLAQKKANPIRNFISANNQAACTVLDDLMIRAGERDLVVQGALDDNEREELRLSQQQAEHDKQVAKDLHRRIDIDKRKMDAASGKRRTQLSQAAVTGLSASKIAKTLGWEQERLDSGFFSSEWLHLSAFSWGGWEPPESKAGFATSQNLENLIFGTSETNSVMTRYEMAWQDFYRKEQDLRQKLADFENSQVKNVRGHLDIYCNDFSWPIQYDYLDKKKNYRFASFTMDPAFVNKLNQQFEENLGSPEPKMLLSLYDGQEDTSKPPFPFQAAGLREMLNLAYSFPTIVYSIQYRVDCYFFSVLLDDPSPKAAFSF